MAGPPEPREARSEGKLHDPAIHTSVSRWMASIRWRYRPETGH